MRLFFFCVISGLLTFSAIVHAGDDVDKSGPELSPPVDTVSVSTFTKKDCDEKIAALKKKHQAAIKKKNNQIADLKASISKLKEKVESLKADKASLEAQLAEAQKPAPEPEPATTNWFPWILALILAVVGFFIGRSTAGGNSPSQKS
ncbi:MAG: hypothetical protein AAF571_08320 [Verrucomicrobiota bacterium]